MNFIATKIPSQKETVTWKGFIFTLIIGAVAWVGGVFFKELGAESIALLLGLLIGNLFALPTALAKGIKFSEKKMLEWAVVFMGAGLNFAVFQQLGWNIITLLIIMISLIIGLGFLLGKWIGGSTTLGGLVGVGTAICGSSAIAAASPIITDKKEEIAFAVGVINLLGTIGIFLLPALIQTFQFSDAMASILIGGGLHAVGQVVASGFMMGETIGEGAVLVKMMRVALLVPAIIVLQIVLRKKTEDKASSAASLIPIFLIGFMLLAVLNSIGIIPELLVQIFKIASKVLLVIALGAIGLNIRFNTLRKKGLRALLIGIIVFVVQLGFLMALVPLIH